MQNGLVQPQQMGALLQSLLAEQRGLRLLGLRSLPVTALADRPPARKATADKGAGGDKAGARRPAARDDAWLYRHTVEVEVQGSYADMLAYLRAIEGLPRRVRWGDVEIDARSLPGQHDDDHALHGQPRKNMVGAMNRLFVPLVLASTIPLPPRCRLAGELPDPTRPPAALRPTTPTAAPYVPAAPALVLQSVLVGEGRKPTAIINGHVVEVGESLEGMRLVRVFDGGAVLAGRERADDAGPDSRDREGRRGAAAGVVGTGGDDPPDTPARRRAADGSHRRSQMKPVARLGGAALAAIVVVAGSGCSTAPTGPNSTMGRIRTSCARPPAPTPREPAPRPDAVERALLPPLQSNCRGPRPAASRASTWRSRTRPPRRCSCRSSPARATASWCIRT